MVSEFGLRVDNSCDCMSLAQWMITCAQQLPLVGFELWLMLVWAIWKHKNEVLWNGTRLPPHEIVLRTEDWMHEFHKWRKPQIRRSAREIQKWRKPGVGWIKCNFDGA